MQTIYCTKSLITGKLLKASDISNSYVKKNIIYINAKEYFNIGKWSTLPMCILIDQSSIFSHLVSYCISNEICLAVVTNEEFSIYNEKNITIDFDKNIITLMCNTYSEEENINDFDCNKVQTIDGTEISFYATIKTYKNALFAGQLGIKSAGLISTEFLYLEDDLSFNDYKNKISKICKNFNGVSSIRLFDYDVNKSYIIEDENIARGIRAYTIDKYKKIIDNQLETCVELSKVYNIEIVIPFVTNIYDILCIQNKLKELNANINICAMVENPSAFLSVRQFSNFVDAFSIGTNDLLQYFFAFDRDSINKEINYINPYSKALLDFLQLYPSDLFNKTRVCGQLPIYPYMLEVLIQLGFRKFSIPSPMIPFIVKKVKKISINHKFSDDIKILYTDDDVKCYIKSNMNK